MSTRYSIVGQTKIPGLDSYLTGILPGTDVMLVREPKNAYDANAIMVWIAGKHVGYIPMKQNGSLAKFIDTNGTDFGVDVMAMDSVKIEQRKAIGATFRRSANSAYPQVEV
jgi:hypothetical protein